MECIIRSPIQLRCEVIIERWKRTRAAGENNEEDGNTQHDTNSLSSQLPCVLLYALQFDLFPTVGWLVDWVGETVVAAVNRRPLMTCCHSTCLHQHCVGVSLVLTVCLDKFGTCDEATWSDLNAPRQYWRESIYVITIVIDQCTSYLRGNITFFLPVNSNTQSSVHLMNLIDD